MRQKAITTIAVGIAVTALAISIYAQSAPRVFMLVTANVQPGHMAEYQSIVEKQVLPIFAKNDVEVIGAFTSALGGPSNQTMLLVAFKDFAHLQTALADPGITQLQAKTFESMRVLDTRLLAPTSYSPIR